MARWKGHELFFRALALLPAALRVRGYVIGGPIYQTEGSQYSVADLRRRAEDLGLTGRVGFTGFVDDPAAAMRALDIVVHASTAPEPFGLVVAEAMACARPVVATAGSGVAEPLVADRDALLYPLGDAAALGARIGRLAADGELRRRLGRHPRATAVARFDRRRLAGEVIAVYQAAVGARR